MGWGTILECINIVLNGFYWNIMCLCSFSKEFWVMDSLGTTGDFLTSHEEIVGVSVVGVVGVEHCVEWSCVCGVSI